VGKSSLSADRTSGVRRAPAKKRVTFSSVPTTLLVRKEEAMKIKTKVKAGPRYAIAIIF